MTLVDMPKPKIWCIWASTTGSMATQEQKRWQIIVVSTSPTASQYRNRNGRLAVFSLASPARVNLFPTFREPNTLHLFTGVPSAQPLTFCRCPLDPTGRRTYAGTLAIGAAFCSNRWCHHSTKDPKQPSSYLLPPVSTESNIVL
jgi:hypothetical protein